MITQIYRTPDQRAQEAREAKKAQRRQRAKDAAKAAAAAVGAAAMLAAGSWADRAYQAATTGQSATTAEARSAE